MPSATPSLAPTERPTLYPTTKPTPEPTSSPVEIWHSIYGFELIIRVRSVSSFFRTYEKLRDILHIPVETTYKNITNYTMSHDIRLFLTYVGPFPIINGTEDIGYSFDGFTYETRKSFCLLHERLSCK